MSGQLNRRDFLGKSMFASLAGGAALGAGLPLKALAGSAVTPIPRTLVHVRLNGAVDTRFMFTPAPNHDEAVSQNDYMGKLWTARSALYPRPYRKYADMFVNEYLPVTDPQSGFQFGIHQSCGWLKTGFDQGKVAIVANTAFAGAGGSSALPQAEITEGGLTRQCEALISACRAPRSGQGQVRAITDDSWNTSDGQYAETTHRLSALLSSAGSLAATHWAVDRLHILSKSPADQLTFCITAERGRQLQANAAAGTGQGQGAYAMLYGAAVRGGVYGEMFPEREARPDGNGRVPLATAGAVIRPHTATEQVLAAAMNWAEPGSGNGMQAALNVARIENGVHLELFSG